jgi:hypothetical protein
MSIASPEAETLTMKQRIFIGVLGALSILLAALVVFYFSPAEETSEALPGRNLSPTVYEDGFGRHSTPTDILADINIPMVSVIWAYNGLDADDMSKGIRNSSSNRTELFGSSSALCGGCRCWRVRILAQHGEVHKPGTERLLTKDF